jgi:hypothetical protein
MTVFNTFLNSFFFSFNIQNTFQHPSSDPFTTKESNIGKKSKTATKKTTAKKKKDPNEPQK